MSNESLNFLQCPHALLLGFEMALGPVLASFGNFPPSYYSLHGLKINRNINKFVKFNKDENVILIFPF